jgi:hypothetical protein
VVLIKHCLVKFQRLSVLFGLEKGVGLTETEAGLLGKDGVVDKK